MGVREVKARREGRGERGEVRERMMRVFPPLSVSWKTAGVYCRLLYSLLRGRTGEWVWQKREDPTSG